MGQAKLKRITFILVVMGILLLASCTSSQDQSEIGTARSFLNALLRDDESHASQYLSLSLQNAVMQYCPNGEVTACLDELGRDEWGALETVIFDYGRPPTGAFGFTIRMENRPGLFVVVVVIEENDRLVINGWRGFTEETDGLIDGTNQINAFPPVGQ